MASPPAAHLPAKRAISTSPPPAAQLASTSTAVSHEAKKPKLDVDVTTASDAAPPTTVSTTTAEPTPTSSKSAPQQPGVKRPRHPRKPKASKAKPAKPGGAEETLHHSLQLLLPASAFELDLAQARKLSEEQYGNGAEGKTVNVRIAEMDAGGLSAHGDGLGRLRVEGLEGAGDNRVVVVPFSLPGELVKVKMVRHESGMLVSHADLVEILEPSPLRELHDGEEVGVGPAPEELKAVQAKFGKRVRCRYFGKCSGCQYQPLSYASQLSIKQQIIRSAFHNFSSLSPDQLPEPLETLPSPKQWEYRTKLTPHFMAPPQSKGQQAKDDWDCTIGFEEKGRKRIVDIEECVIATDVINTQLAIERKKIKATIQNYKKGSTLLLRDSLPPRPAPSSSPHVAVTIHSASVREHIEPSFELTQLAGSFFQNNNSILPSLLAYISSSLPPKKNTEEKRFLVDTYCGSGLFAICLSGEFENVKGVEIDKNSVKFAKENAELNKGEGRGDVSFVDGKAEEIFKSITSPPEQTTILIDPPRKGCDTLFLTQLLAFKPQSIIYVSCNVHTQARDVGVLVKDGGYRIESLRAADLFPQTHHAEGVAVLVRD